MHIEFAYGAPNGASYLQAQTLFQHYATALACGPPQMSFIDIRNQELSPRAISEMQNAEFGQIVNQPALPYLSVGCLFYGRQALVCFQPSEMAQFFPSITHLENKWQIVPRIDAAIYFCDGTGERLNCTICRMQTPYFNTGEFLTCGWFVVWHAAVNSYISNDYRITLTALLMHAYYLAQHRMIECETRFVWRERQNPAVPTARQYTPPADYQPIRLLSEVDMNPTPTAGVSTRENHCEVWRVRGHYRENPHGGEPIWVNSYLKGPERNNPNANPLLHTYVES